MFGSIADRLVLVPSTDAIDANGQQRRVIAGELGELEVFERVQASTNEPPASQSEEARSSSASATPILVLKFPGAGGRAERSSPHPTEAWPDLASVVWTVNQPGYGGSAGRPSIRNLGTTATTVFEAAKQRFPDHAVVACGNSLGNLPALFLAARYPDQIAGVLMRNPPPLRQVIEQRHPWWKTFGIAALIACAIPDELDCITNASQARARAVMVTCESDRVVPASLQQEILTAYGGETRQLLARGVDHAEPIPDDQLVEYAALLDWLVMPLRK